MSESMKTEAGDREGRDTLTEVLRAGARKLIAQALEADLAELLADHTEQRETEERQKTQVVDLLARPDGLELPTLGCEDRVYPIFGEHSRAR